MSYDHVTYGFDTFDKYLKVLKQDGIQFEVQEYGGRIQRWQGCMCGYCGYGGEPFEEWCICCRNECKHYQPLRTALLEAGQGRKVVIEEYLKVDDRDCDGESYIDVVAYFLGKRPQLRRDVSSPGYDQRWTEEVPIPPHLTSI